MMRKHPSGCDCPRCECMYSTIVEPWLTIEAHNGRLKQRIVDLILQVSQAKLPTPQGCLHPGCLHLPRKECDTIAKEHQEQGGLLATRKVGKLTEGSDQQARRVRSRLRAKAARESAASKESNAVCTGEGEEQLQWSAPSQSWNPCRATLAQRAKGHRIGKAHMLEHCQQEGDGITARAWCITGPREGKRTIHGTLEAHPP